MASARLRPPVPLCKASTAGATGQALSPPGREQVCVLGAHGPVLPGSPAAWKAQARGWLSLLQEPRLGTPGRPVGHRRLFHSNAGVWAETAPSVDPCGAPSHSVGSPRTEAGSQDVSRESLSFSTGPGKLVDIPETSPGVTDIRPHDQQVTKASPVRSGENKA